MENFGWSDKKIENTVVNLDKRITELFSPTATIVHNKISAGSLPSRDWEFISVFNHN